MAAKGTIFKTDTNMFYFILCNIWDKNRILRDEYIV